MPDGTVEAHLEGDAAAVAEMIVRMQGGPSRAQVERVEQRETTSQGLQGFSRR